MSKVKKTRSKAMYGISRIDDDIHRTHAWRVSLRRQGKMHVKNFPDKKYGGKRKALNLAKEHRDKVIKKYPPTTRKQFCTVIRRNNNTGISGVCTYAKPYVLKDGTVKEIRYWEANWPDENNQNVSVSFSVKTYGETVARYMAIRAREKGLKKVTGYFWASERGDPKAAKTQKSTRKAS
jgi:hypothetical protein